MRLRQKVKAVDEISARLKACLHEQIKRKIWQHNEENFFAVRRLHGVEEFFQRLRIFGEDNLFVVADGKNFLYGVEILRHSEK